MNNEEFFNEWNHFELLGDFNFPVYNGKVANVGEYFNIQDFNTEFSGKSINLKKGDIFSIKSIQVSYRNIFDRISIDYVSVLSIDFRTSLISPTNIGKEFIKMNTSIFKDNSLKINLNLVISDAHFRPCIQILQLHT